MKTTPKSATAAAITILALSGTAFAAPAGVDTTPETIPAIPLGALTAYPEVVQTGTYPTLTWAILHPSKVGDVASITPPGTIKLNKPMWVTVQAVGVGVTGGTSGQNPSSTNAELRMSVNGGGYDQLFYGTQSNVDPVQVLYIKKLSEGSTIDFGSRFVSDNNWTPFYTTRSANMQVISLVKGDAIPTTFDITGSGKVSSALTPYVDGAGKVDIGPMSVLVLAELAETNSADSDFDYQDSAFLVSFSPKRGNNGHGNNVDGVDSSNPGAGSGGPNGSVDPSGGVDDEIR